MRILLNCILPENRFDLTAIFFIFSFHVPQVLLQNSQQKIGKFFALSMSKNAHPVQDRYKRENVIKKKNIELAIPNACDRTKWRGVVKSIETIQNPTNSANGKEPQTKLN